MSVLYYGTSYFVLTTDGRLVLWRQSHDLLLYWFEAQFVKVREPHFFFLEEGKSAGTSGAIIELTISIPPTRVTKGTDS